jgi:primosomal protein N'
VVERLRNQWRWQLLISAPERRDLWAVLARVEAMALPSGVRRIVDVDPSSTL